MTPLIRFARPDDMEQVVQLSRSLSTYFGEGGAWDEPERLRAHWDLYDGHGGLRLVVEDAEQDGNPIIGLSEVWISEEPAPIGPNGAIEYLIHDPRDRALAERFLLEISRRVTERGIGTLTICPWSSCGYFENDVARYLIDLRSWERLHSSSRVLIDPKRLGDPDVEFRSDRTTGACELVGKLVSPRQIEPPDFFWHGIWSGMHEPAAFEVFLPSGREELPAVIAMWRWPVPDVHYEFAAWVPPNMLHDAGLLLNLLRISARLFPQARDGGFHAALLDELVEQLPAQAFSPSGPTTELRFIRAVG